jgi:outer membrane lipoprotein-sorting protein
MSRLKDGQGQGIVIEKIEVNPKVEDSMFKFPEN